MMPLIVRCGGDQRSVRLSRGKPVSSIVSQDCARVSLFFYNGRHLHHSWSLSQCDIPDDAIIDVEDTFEVSLHFDDDTKCIMSLSSSSKASYVMSLSPMCFRFNISYLKTATALWPLHYSARDCGISAGDDIYAYGSVVATCDSFLGCERLFLRMPGILAREREARRQLLARDNRTAVVHFVGICRWTISIRVSTRTDIPEICAFLERYYGVALPVSDASSSLFLHPNSVLP